jgi:hypothetical protein
MPWDAEAVAVRTLCVLAASIWEGVALEWKLETGM